MAEGIPTRLSAADGRQFGLTVGGAFLALAGVFWWRNRPTGALVAGTLGGLLVLAGIAVPAQLGPVYRAWMGLALAMSKVTTPIFMGIIYFLVLTPIGVLRRTIGGNPMRQAGNASSTWISRDATTGRRSDLQHHF